MSNKTTNSYIEIKGAKVHNLKNINLKLERNKLIVVTGVSGSGKSSLAFDTLYAEGQRRYVESLSSYARQFLGRMNKPEVDFIKGIPPAIAIEQKVNTNNTRSTVGTSTEIYDYMKLLFARIGQTYSPISGDVVKKNNVQDVVDYIVSLSADANVLLLSPLHIPQQRTLNDMVGMLIQQGFSRFEADGKIVKANDLDTTKKYKSINIVIDRIRVATDNDTVSRIADSVQTAYFEGNGICIVKQMDNDKQKIFSSKFEADGITFDEPSVNMFTFNNPVGACPLCEGFGHIIDIDPDLVIPNKNLSVYDDAIVCWRGEKMQEWKNKLIYSASKFDFPIHKPVKDLTDKQIELLWTGNKYFYGLNTFFEHLKKKAYKIQYRVMMSRYRGRTICPDCKGTRLNKNANYVKVAGKSISELVLMPISELAEFFSSLTLDDYNKKIAERILTEINSRISFLQDVGLGYLTLNRLSSTLSGGESQRINLATSLGSTLTGSLYILDEPSIGLHSRDTMLLIKVLRKLQQLGNTVIVVEHDEQIMRSADVIVDIGPLAGQLGGEVVFCGTAEQIDKDKNSLTAKYLTGELSIPTPSKRRKWSNFIEITDVYENNLKNISVKFPLDVITVVSGVSGSGKSSLVNKVFYSALKKHKGEYVDSTKIKYGELRGDINLIDDVEMVDQNPIGKSSRSNPATYIKAYDEIRKLFANQKSAKLMGFKSSHFSFNIDGGRCEECAGEGTITVEMQFMADVRLICESCKGKRFKNDVLDVKYKGKNISDVLDMTVNEAVTFFTENPNNITQKIVDKLKPLVDVGLGYVKLGQSSNTLSGGESQRIKLASFLSKEKQSKPMLFIFDEPTTGLHFHDINKLIDAFNALVKKGNSIIIIEHNPEIIKNADWVIDLGAEGGKQGGDIVFEGTPEDLVKCEKSYTGKYLDGLC